MMFSIYRAAIEEENGNNGSAKETNLEKGEMGFFFPNGRMTAVVKDLRRSISYLLYSMCE